MSELEVVKAEARRTLPLRLVARLKTLLDRPGAIEDLLAQSESRSPVFVAELEELGDQVRLLRNELVKVVVDLGEHSDERTDFGHEGSLSVDGQASEAPGPVAKTVGDAADTSLRVSAEGAADVLASAAPDGCTVQVCVLCHRERTLFDAYDYNPLQVLTHQPLGWYSGDDGEICPECMTRTMAGDLR